MNREKISSQEIIDLVATKASVSKRAAEEFLKVMIASIEEALLAGEVVKIKNFGTFKLLWNEPRKSVNVQSHEEITLAGYYKVGFVPDAVLRVQVNEPFAHLEPVELDVKTNANDRGEKNEDAALDPLRIFTEQATEIRSLISEIQALSSTPKTTIAEEKKKDEDIAEINQFEKFPQIDLEFQDESETTDLIAEQQEAQTQQVNTHDISEEEIEYVLGLPQNTNNDNSQISSELPVTPYLSNIITPRKNRTWMWLLIIIFSMTALGAGFYYIYPPATEFTKMTLAKCEYSVTKISEEISSSEMIHSISGWFAPSAQKTLSPETVIIPKDANDFDSINQNQPVDSLQVLFDNPRVYSDFIASERIKNGSRLTIMSKRYYGSKEYWVYIYEANKDQIQNPDDIPVGTLIRIPKLDLRLIDQANPRCIKKARELHDIYIR